MAFSHSQKLLFIVNDTEFFLSHRQSLAEACKNSFKVALLVPRHPDNALIRKSGFSVMEYPLQKTGINPFYDLLTLYKLFRIIKREKPILVHSFTIKPSLYGSLACRLAGVPHVFVTITGLGFVYSSQSIKSRIIKPIVNGLYRLAFNNPRLKVIFQNPDDKNRLIKEELIQQKQAFVVPGSGVDPKKFFPQPEMENTKTIKILVPCRMIVEKGVREAVEAFKQIKKNHSVELILAGKIPKANPNAVAESEIKTWIRDQDIHWPGHMEDMNKLYNSCHIVCLPSYGEGLPLSLLEASLCQKAIVTTQAPGCNLIVEHEKNGLLVPVRDIPALAKALERFITDPSLRSRLGRQARIKVLESHTQEVINKQISETVQ